MRISSEFMVQANPDHVFETLLNPLVMQGCIPGCTELSMIDETHYTGNLTNEIAHVKFNAAFTAELTELKKPNNIKVVLSGDDRKLATSISVVISLEVTSNGSDSKIHYDMDVAIRGKLGRLGEPIIRRRSAEVERDFVAALTRSFRTPELSAYHSEPYTDADLAAPTGLLVTDVTNPLKQESEPTVRVSWLRRVFSFFRRKR